MRRIALAGLVAVTALAASACGGGGDGASGTPPNEYAASVCGAISSWQQELQTSATNMSSDLGTAPSPEQVKAKLVEFMDGAVKSTDTMISKVEDAGPPAIDKGETLQSDLENGLGQAKKAFESARDRAKTLPANDPAAFQREAAALSQTLTEEGTRIQTTFEGLSSKYDSDELNKAFDEQAACKAL